MNIKQFFMKLNIFSSFTKIKELENRNKELEENLKAKQEHINKTNAYWKNELRKTKMKLKS